MHVSSPVCNGLLRLTSGMTAADILTVSILDKCYYTFSTIDVDSNSESNHSPKDYLIVTPTLQANQMQQLVTTFKGATRDL